MAAPKKFATMLQRKANRINTILVYAVLEWLLIVLLFLNGLFSYIIRKFAQRFGLRPPCLFCSRVDHLLEQQNNTSNSYGDLMCEAHATEISRLSYCPSHHKLTVFEHLCTNCLDSHLICNEKVIKLSPKVTSISWVGETKNDCKDKRCSCCDKITSSCLLFKPSWVVLEHAQKTYLLTEVLQDNESKGPKLDISKSDIQEHCCEGSQVDEQPSVGRFSFGEAIEECILTSKPEFHSNDIIQNTIQKYKGAKSSIDVSTTTKPMYNEVVNRFSEMSEYSDLDHISLGEVYEDTTVISPRSLDIHVEGYVVAKPSDYQEYKCVEQEISTLIEHSPGPKEVEVEEEKCWDRSEMESAIGDSTIEKLKSALESERTALKSLQGELEEERNAAAIAANQTLAMITRLQEEKSAMQMEALHYQRMMEEQSEYDQEALQILNDLVIKREKEKLELEKDLEMCQKKVSDYEAKEKTMIMNNSESLRSNSSIASSSNMDDEDELYIDFIHDEKVNNHCSKDNTHELVSEMEEDELECMKHLSILDESIAQFEDERTSILEELKALEEKLFTLADNNEEIFEDRYHNDRDRDVHYQEVDAKYKFSSGNINVEGDSNKEDVIGSTTKELLPLFDATCFQSDSEGNMKYESVGNENKMVKNTFSREDEVDHVYRRLQALEADKDFLKHCFSSLKQGDKGRELLEEILEHFWDLRTVEIQVRRNRGKI